MLELVAWTGWHFERGDGPTAPEVLARHVRLLRREVVPVLEWLAEAGFLVRVDDGYLLPRPAEAILMRDIVHAWRRWEAGEGEAYDPSRADLEVSRALERSLPPTVQDAVIRWVQPEVNDAGQARRSVG